MVLQDCSTTLKSAPGQPDVRTILRDYMNSKFVVPLVGELYKSMRGQWTDTCDNIDMRECARTIQVLSKGKCNIDDK